MFRLTFLFKWSPLIIVVAFLISCGGGSPPSNVTVVSFESNGTTCSPDSIDTRQGYLVKVTLKNNGTSEVTFSYPDGPYTFKAAPGQTALGNFTAPTATGNYKFQCAQTEGKMNVRNSQ